MISYWIMSHIGYSLTKELFEIASFWEGKWEPIEDEL